jgi:NADH:ubiquinone oxidoreductase subunit 5 (subunit L)/multisubunit Na+/H+ antiporter MnhA subunit
MEKDPHFTRFMSYLSLFTFFMLVLLSADNFTRLFLGWEGVGASSYLLICFCLLFLEAFLLFAFGVSDLLFFFFLFESVLIPMFFIVGIWGSGYQRIRAAYYFFFFTLAGSVFSLIAIFVVFTVNGSTLFYIILNSWYLNWQLELLFFFFGV